MINKNFELGGPFRENHIYYEYFIYYNTRHNLQQSVWQNT